MKNAMLVIVLLTIVGIAGCQVASKWIATNDEALRAVTSAAVERIIDGDPEVQDRVIKVTEELRGYIDGTPEARASSIVAVARDKIRWGRLDETESRIVEALLDRLQTEIADAQDEGMIDHDQRVTIKKLLDMIEQAAYEADVEAVALA